MFSYAVAYLVLTPPVLANELPFDIFDEDALLNAATYSNAHPLKSYIPVMFPVVLDS